MMRGVPFLCDTADSHEMMTEFLLFFCCFLYSIGVSGFQPRLRRFGLSLCAASINHQNRKQRLLCLLAAGRCCRSLITLLAAPARTHTRRTVAPRCSRCARPMNILFGRNQVKTDVSLCSFASGANHWITPAVCAPARRYFPTRIHVSCVRLSRGSGRWPQPECLWRECSLAD